jgi:hypothetical protein
MSRKAETKFRARIKPRLESLPNTVVFSIQQQTIRGTPDLLVCCRGVFVALELKAAGKSPVSPLQAYNISRISKAFGLAYVVHPDNFEVVLAVLSRIANGEAADLLSRLPITTTGEFEKDKLC